MDWYKNLDIYVWKKVKPLQDFTPWQIKWLFTWTQRLFNHWKVLSKLWHCHLEVFYHYLVPDLHSCGMVKFHSQSPRGFHPPKKLSYPSIIRWSIHRLYLHLIQSSYYNFYSAQEKFLLTANSGAYHLHTGGALYATPCWWGFIKHTDGAILSSSIGHYLGVNPEGEFTWEELEQLPTAQSSTIYSEDPFYGLCEYNGNLISFTAFMGTSEVCNVLPTAPAGSGWRSPAVAHSWAPWCGGTWRWRTQRYRDQEAKRERKRPATAAWSHHSPATSAYCSRVQRTQHTHFQFWQAYTCLTI